MMLKKEKMKTLNEVIYQLENCAYTPLTNDALYYLKEYQDTKNALDAEREKTIEAYCQWKDAKEKLETQTSHMMWVDNHFQFEISDNPPLTWDELKTMKGKPVWIEITYPGYQHGEWDVINYVEDDEMTTYRDDYERKQMSKTWQAYRREKDETN